MRRSKSRIFAACVALALGATPAVSAEAFMYECDMADASRSQGWISPKIALIFAKDGSVKAVDAVILHFAGGPIKGTVLRNNASRAVVKWTVKGAKADNGTSFADFDYRASIGKKSGKVDLTAIPHGYDKGLRSGGSCKKRTG
ncbi:hypothetical protein ABMC88_06650 [Sulfitobacter sp. HNIBRBA2951]|uniref:hypothetical protein n=1 Tax=Sulfitobacter aquimarinus TaxID=3158557 RepID=UPI0032DF2601